MKAVVQRVRHASVTVADRVTGQIDKGLLVLVCADPQDTEKEAAYLASKIVKMRIFNDDAGKMNKSVVDINGQILAVSQFTLAAEWKKGNRPGFSKAAKPTLANELYEQFCRGVTACGVTVQKGVFAADMQVALTNDGPVTIVMDTQNPK